VPEYDVVVEWVPFELHPEIPLEGIPVNPGRYGRFVEMAAEAGLPFEAPTMVPNTRRSLATAEAVRAKWPDAFEQIIGLRTHHKVAVGDDVGRDSADHQVFGFGAAGVQVIAEPI